MHQHNGVTELEAEFMLIKYFSLSERELDSCKELFLSACCIDEYNTFITEIEAGLTLGILTTHIIL